MKLNSTVLLLAAVCDAAFAAGTARVFTHNHQKQVPTSENLPTILDPVSARLVLAQRAGVEDYHNADLSSPEVLDAINTYGVRTPLFAVEKESDDSLRRRAFILVRSEADTDSQSLTKYTTFKLSSAPIDQASQDLWVDLARQSGVDRTAAMHDSDIWLLMNERQTFTVNGNMFYTTKSMEDFESLVHRLVDGKWDITALITTPSSNAETHNAASAWGTYEMPGKQSPLQKRQTTKEAPLAEVPTSKPAFKESAPITPFANNSTPLRGILSACFHSQEICERQTRNCTGHGKCHLKYHDKTAPVNSDCYTCQCSASTSSNEGKKTTTRWGGPACQKKDVSVEFWLIALFTIAMIFLIGFAVGTIRAMGDEELPSVIGAGVSGPSGRK